MFHKFPSHPNEATASMGQKLIFLMIIQFYVCMFFWMVFLLTLCWCYSSYSLLNKNLQFLYIFFFGWKLYHNYMFNVLFLQTIIIHPEKYNLPLSRCVLCILGIAHSEWEKEFRWNQLGRQLTSEYYIISQCTHINEAITRRWLGALSPLASFIRILHKYDMFLLLLSPCRHYCPLLSKLT